MKYKAEMQKIKRYSHMLRIVTNVFYWAAIAAAAGSLLALIIIRLLPDTHFELSAGSIGHSGFSLNSIIKYDVNDVSLQGVSMKNVYLTIMLMSAVIFGLMIPALKQLVLILKTVEEDKPFTVENAKRISSLGGILVICSFLIPAIEVLVANAIIDTLKIQDISTNYSMNVLLLLAGLMLFILGGIFKYGSYLQYEYDETV